MFTKQHFQALAKLLKETDAKTKYELAQDLAKLFSEDNPKFNSKNFRVNGNTIDIWVLSWVTQVHKI